MHWTKVADYPVYIEGVLYRLTDFEAKNLLKEYHYEKAKRVARQGGEIHFTINCLKPGLITL